MFKHTFEETDKDGVTLLQANYDSSGLIGQIFVYSDFFSDIVPVDLEVFYNMYPTKYARLQARIFDAIGSGDLYE